MDEKGSQWSAASVIGRVKEAGRYWLGSWHGFFVLTSVQDFTVLLISYSVLGVLYCIGLSGYFVRVLGWIATSFALTFIFMSSPAQSTGGGFFASLAGI